MAGKKALIVGVTGQDGAYLSQLLLQKGYTVYGGKRRTSHANLDNLQALHVLDQIQLVPVDLSEPLNLFRTIEKTDPDEIYNLAAQSFVGVSFEHPLVTSEITALGPLRLLEAVRTVNPKIKYYQASSSEMFGNTPESPQQENTPFSPVSPYGIAKLFAHQMTQNYRSSYGLFACGGILFNHESPLRGPEFVTRKITMTAARIKEGLAHELVLGDLTPRRDWGYAPEYVEAMWLMLQQAEPEDYVIATGESHTVQEFVETAFAYLGLSWQSYVRTESHLKRPTELYHLVGHAAKARQKLGWAPQTPFQKLVHLMIDHDLQRLRKSL